MNATTKPSVHIHESNANPAHLSEICAGLEEEGIPYAIFKADGSAKHLAYTAANSARLGVGIGITAEFALIQIRNCPMDILIDDTANQGIHTTDKHISEGEIRCANTQHHSPTLHINLNTPQTNSQCRALGTNAARSVKGGMFI